jgi:hypothetical protein
MRAYVELTAAEKKLLVELTAEERAAVVEQMLETVTEEIEWQVAVERARTVAETVPAVVTRIAPPPPPVPGSRARWESPGQRYRWPSVAHGAKK